MSIKLGSLDQTVRTVAKKAPKKVKAPVIKDPALAAKYAEVQSQLAETQALKSKAWANLRGKVVSFFTPKTTAKNPEKAFITEAFAPKAKAPAAPKAPRRSIAQVLADRASARTEIERTTGSTVGIKIERAADNVLAAILSPRKTISSKLAIAENNLGVRATNRTLKESKEGKSIGTRLGAGLDGVESALLHPVRTGIALLKAVTVKPFKSVIKFSNNLAAKQDAKAAAKASENAVKTAQKNAENAAKAEYEAGIKEWNDGVKAREAASKAAKAADAKAAAAKQKTANKAARAAEEAPRKELRATMRAQRKNQIKYDAKQAVTKAETFVTETVPKTISKKASDVAKKTGIADIAAASRKTKELKATAAAIETQAKIGEISASKEELSASLASLQAQAKKKASVIKGAETKAVKTPQYKAAIKAGNERLNTINAQLAAIKGSRTKANKALTLSLKAEADTIRANNEAQQKKINEAIKLAVRLTAHKAELAKIQTQIAAHNATISGFDKSIAKLQPKQQPKAEKAKA